MRYVGVFLLFVLLHIFVPLATHADLYVPQPECPDNYTYIDKSEAIAGQYKNIVDAKKSDMFAFPFMKDGVVCVEISEYCKKTNCSFPYILENIITSKGFLAKNIALNLVVNFIIILCLYFISKANIVSIFRFRSLLAIVFITALGYISDLIGIFFALVLHTRLCFLGGNFCGNTYYKSSLSERISSPIGVLLTIVLTGVIFALVSTIFYFLYSGRLSQDKSVRKKLSMIFGILSNPIWIILINAILVILL